MSVVGAIVASGFPVPPGDTIAVGGIPAPGQWILQSTYREFGWQIQKGFAFSGATVLPTGDELLVAPFLVKIWAEPQFDSFRLFRRQFLKKATYSPAGALIGFALGIVHPELSDMGITTFVVKKSPVLINNGKGLWTGTCEFLEYRKAVIAAGKPKAAIPAANAPPTAPLSVEAQRHAAKRALIDSRTTDPGVT